MSFKQKVQANALEAPCAILIMTSSGPSKFKFKLPNSDPERECECVEIKNSITVSYSPSADGYYNKTCILCIAWLA